MDTQTLILAVLYIIAISFIGAIYFHCIAPYWSGFTDDERNGD